MDSDQLVIAVSRDGALRARVAVTTQLCREGARRHQCGALASHALARALTCAALFPISLKDTDRLSLQFSGGGALRGLFVELRAPGHLRGYVRAPQAALWAGDPRGPRIGRALMPGFVHVLRQVPSGGFTQGQVELVSGEIDDDLESYFLQSEQIPTRVRAITHLLEDGTIASADGVLVQALPGGALPPVIDDEPDPAEHAVEVQAKLKRVLGPDYSVLEIVPLSFACPCSRERALGGIGLLSPDEILEMVHDDHGAEVRCDFCGTLYKLDAAELLALLDR